VKGLVNADHICARLRLGDGGIYDNMGTEALWKSMDRVLISDAEAPFAFIPPPWLNWASQLGRVDKGAAQSVLLADRGAADSSIGISAENPCSPIM